MNPSIQVLVEKKLVGKRLRMSLAENKTFDLWKSFMPRKNEIYNNVGSDLISMQVYDKSFEFKNFSMETTFDKWAAVEVKDFNIIPQDMESFILEGGLYAVFQYKGAASGGPKIFQYIFGTWLPGSDYVLDNRPHFEVLGEKYKNEDPSSEEEIWIPIKAKK